MDKKSYTQLLREMPSGLDRAILRILSFHTGKSIALGRGALVHGLHNDFGLDVGERMARQCIHDLRRSGHLICSTPGEEGGYYLAANLEEFREFCERELHPKAIDMLETESAMKAAARQQFGEAVQVRLI
jgi:hypothetical protein